MKVAIIGVAVAGACLAPHQGWHPPPRATRPRARRRRRRRGRSLPPGWFGPEWPPSDTSLLAALGRDAWIHPLAGPVRRMPIRDSRVFGAVRPGNRAVECRNGHCGVDLGGEIWGEHIRAVHDGVVDFVRRGPHEQHGGQFVRISHRDGTVFTQYFHVAAIPRRIERGVVVKGGDVIGLLGDTRREGLRAPPAFFDLDTAVAGSAGEVFRSGAADGAVAAAGPARGQRGAAWSRRSPSPGVPLGSMPLLVGRKRSSPAAALKKRGASAARTRRRRRRPVATRVAARAVGR